MEQGRDRIRVDHTGTNGRVQAWVDDAQAVNWTGKIGYTPASSGGQTGTTLSRPHHLRHAVLP
jgi:hypothetical protein